MASTHDLSVEPALTRAERDRLRWRSLRRGLLELDLLFERFLNNDFDRLSDAEQRAFARLVDEEDYVLWDRLQTAEPLSAEEPTAEARVLERLRKRLWQPRPSRRGSQ